MKYKNLKELAAAFSSGELSRKTWFLSVDEKTSQLAWSFDGHDPADDAYWDEKFKQGRELFEGKGVEDFLELCNVAGIPADWA